jgi:type IV secretion system protein VirB1
MMGCQDLAVPAAVMRHIVHVESGANPYAIGVVGGRLVRQPKSLDEAVATARMLEAKGYDFSLGLAQVHRANLGKYGLDTHEKAFDACANLSAGARILAGCHTSAQGDWGKAFSCYYSGNFVTGFQDGYVQRVYDSIRRGRTVADNGTLVEAIPLRTAGRPTASPAVDATRPQATPTTGAADRIAMRSLPLNATAETVIAPAIPAPIPATPDVFVPQVRGPAGVPADQADLRKGGPDGAFVF